MTKVRLLFFITGIVLGELIGALVRGFFPPVPGWPFRISLLVSMAGIAALIIAAGKPSERVGDLVFSAFAGTYLGYVF